MSTLPAPITATRRCPTCHVPAEISCETRTLSCGHVAFLVDLGGRDAVVGWANSVDCALNLERVLNMWTNAGRTPASTIRMADRAEQHAAGVEAWRERAKKMAEQG